MTKSFAAAALPSLSKTMKVTPKKITKRSLSADVVWKIVITTVASVFIAYSLYEVYNLKAQLNNLQLLVETRCSSQSKKEPVTPKERRSIGFEGQSNTILDIDADDIIHPTIQSLTAKTTKSAPATQSSPIVKTRKKKKNNKQDGGGSQQDPGYRIDYLTPTNVDSRKIRSGSTFVRWGKPSCPEAASPVYSGYAAAAYSSAGYGGATQLECLPTDPSWHPDSNTDFLSSTLLTTAKFSLGQHDGVFPPTAENSVIECAVCFTRKPTTLMIPGWVNCPPSWRREYTGYLMSTPGVASEFYFSSKNYCVDRNPDTYFTGHNDTNGLQLTFVQAGHCFQRAAPCTEYRKRKRISCAVCSKLK